MFPNALAAVAIQARDYTLQAVWSTVWKQAANRLFAQHVMNSHPCHVFKGYMPSITIPAPSMPG